jgi:hypothetical protein
MGDAFVPRHPCHQPVIIVADDPCRLMPFHDVPRRRNAMHHLRGMNTLEVQPIEVSAE